MKIVNTLFIKRQIWKAERRAAKTTGLVKTYENRMGYTIPVWMPKTKNTFTCSVDDALTLMVCGYDDIAHGLRDYGKYMYISKHTHNKLEKQVGQLVKNCEEKISKSAKEKFKSEAYVPSVENNNVQEAYQENLIESDEVKSETSEKIEKN